MVKLISLSFLLILTLQLAACDQKPTATAYSTVKVSQAQNRQADEVKRPWMLKIGSSGGLSGEGEGGVIITWQGDVATSQPRRSLYLPCQAELPEAELQKIEQFVLSARPSGWGFSYEANSRCSDQMEYWLDLHVLQADGLPRMYSTSWSDCPIGTLPDDLVALHKAARMVKVDVGKGCVKSPFY